MVSEEIKQRAKIWLGEEFDSVTRREVQRLIDEDEKALIDAFYTDLEFGTGGLRGIMGVGTNRMNIYTVGMATQGLANYLHKFYGQCKISVAIAYDSRNNSQLFAERTAEIFAANNIDVFLYDSLRPVPALSFAVRHYHCNCGVVITASHNPPEYNGYKVYWNDGGQIIAPHDKGIIEEVRKITNVNEIKRDTDKNKIQIIGNETDEIFLQKVYDISLNPNIITANNNLKIVYTPIHGSGITLVPKALEQLGFSEIYIVPEQEKPNGNFPTVSSPNPEEPSALKMAIDLAIAIDADLVMGTDPDADRLGVVVKNKEGEYILLNGNQTATLLCWYTLSQYREKELFKGNEFYTKTIVTTDLLDTIAADYGVDCYNVLTGFKYIAETIHNLEGKYKYIGGGEESYGYLASDHVRDKDAVSSCALFAELAAFAKSKGTTVFELLLNIYVQYGLYCERLVNVVRKGFDGVAEIKAMMTQYRDNPPEIIDGAKVISIKDYEKREAFDCISGKTEAINLPKSNVLQFILDNGSKITIRPSGTEPKIKFYFSVNKKINSREGYREGVNELNKRIDSIATYLGISE